MGGQSLSGRHFLSLNKPTTAARVRLITLIRPTEQQQQGTAADRWPRKRCSVGGPDRDHARVSAAVGMLVQNYYPQGERCWLRRHEKGGKFHEVPCHHKAEEYLDAYIAAAGLKEHPKTPLFRSTRGRINQLTAQGMSRVDAFRVVQRRAKTTGLKGRVSNHSFRATGITVYLENGGSLETAAHIAAHESPRTTKLYDRTADNITLEEIERIRF